MTTLMSIENKAFGLLVRLVAPNRQTLATATVCGNELHEVWVAPDYRGRGVGRAITVAALQATDVHQARVVNPAMAHILESMGWVTFDGTRYVH